MLSILVYSLVGVLKYYLPGFLCNVLLMLSALTFIVTVLRNIRGAQLREMTGFFFSFLILWSVLLTLHMFFIADVKSTFVEYKGITTWLLAYFGSLMFLPNLMDHKVTTGADWFKGIYDDYVYVANDLDDAFDIVTSIRSKNINNTLNPAFATNYYDNLKKIFEDIHNK